MQLQGKIIRPFSNLHVGKTLGHFVMIPGSGEFQGSTVGVVITESTDASNKPTELKMHIEVDVHPLDKPQQTIPELRAWYADCQFWVSAETCKIIPPPLQE